MVKKSSAKELLSKKAVRMGQESGEWLCYGKGISTIRLIGIPLSGSYKPVKSNRFVCCTAMEWELAVIVEEAAKAATAGGPFWAIGNNNEIE